MAYVGPIFALCWPCVALCWAYLGPMLAMLAYVGPMLAYVGPMLAQLGAYVGASVASFWAIYVEAPSRCQRFRFFPSLEPKTTYKPRFFHIADIKSVAAERAETP